MAKLKITPILLLILNLIFVFCTNSDLIAQDWLGTEKIEIKLNLNPEEIVSEHNTNNVSSFEVLNINSTFHVWLKAFTIREKDKDLHLYISRSGNESWNASIYANAEDINSESCQRAGTPIKLAQAKLSFTSDGKLIDPASAKIQLSLDWNGYDQQQNIIVDLSGTTSYSNTATALISMLNSPDSSPTWRGWVPFDPITQVSGSRVSIQIFPLTSALTNQYILERGRDRRTINSSSQYLELFDLPAGIWRIKYRSFAYFGGAPQTGKFSAWRYFKVVPSKTRKHEYNF